MNAGPGIGEARIWGFLAGLDVSGSAVAKMAPSRRWAVRSPRIRLRSVAIRGLTPPVPIPARAVCPPGSRSSLTGKILYFLAKKCFAVSGRPLPTSGFGNSWSGSTPGPRSRNLEYRIRQRRKCRMTNARRSQRPDWVSFEIHHSRFAIRYSLEDSSCLVPATPRQAEMCFRPSSRMAKPLAN